MEELLKNKNGGSQSKTTFNIFGACVSRDIFPKSTEFLINQYVSFSSPMSLFLPKNNIELNMEDLSELKWGSDFSKRCLVLDHNNQGLDYLFAKDSDWLLLDFADIRMRLLKYGDGNYTTYTNLIAKNTEQFHQLFGDWQIVPRAKIENLRASIIWLCNKILEKYKPQQIILHEYYMVDQYLAKNGTLKFYNSKQNNKNSIYEANKILKELYTVAEKLLDGCYVIKMPEHVMGDARHIWGLYPLHYHKYYYDYAYEALKYIVKNKKNPPDSLIEKYETLLLDVENQAKQKRIDVDSEKQKTHVLWTGGMDSTLVILLLSQIEGINLKPVYICKTNGRKTENVELKTMNKIYEILKNDKRTKANLLPIRIVADKKEDIPKEANEFQYEYYKRVRYLESANKLKKAQKLILSLQKNVADGILKSNIVRLADQYVAAISYAKSIETQVSIGIMDGESIFKLKGLTNTKKSIINGISTYTLDKEGTNEDIYNVFENINFPLYGIKKKRDLYKMYDEMGYSYIRDMVWHCYLPINGKPCGQCVTCVPYIREGIYDRFDRDALIRYIQFAEKERAVINEQYKDIIDKLSDKK